MKTIHMVGIACAFIPLMGCPRGGGQIREVAEEEIAEAVINQAISSYYEATFSVSGEYATINLACTKGGTLSWAEFEEANEICFSANSSGCSISGENYDALSLTGAYDVCGFPPSAETGAITDLDGRTLYLDGSVTISGTNIESRTCNYELQVTAIDVTVEGSVVTFASGVSGTMCDRRNMSMEISFTVTGDVEASEDTATE